MRPNRAAQALAEASSAMTRSHDTAGALTALLRSCQAGLDVDASGILVAQRGRLEFLASSSHRASELETHQLHLDEGPCIQAKNTGKIVQAHASGDLQHRWPDFSRTMLAAGFSSVHASPLNFQGSTVGAMGLFRRADTLFTPDEDAIAQAFADIATILLFNVDEMPNQLVAQRLQKALDSRVLIEQAKGVLADSRNVSVAEAFDLLVDTANELNQPLTDWAAHVIRHAQVPPAED